MDQQSLRKTYQEQLRPTPAQERQLEAVLWRCRALYNGALEPAHHRLVALPRLHHALPAGS
jgi:Helix-turn-helix domain